MCSNLVPLPPTTNLILPNFSKLFFSVFVSEKSQVAAPPIDASGASHLQVGAATTKSSAYRTFKGGGALLQDH